MILWAKYGTQTSFTFPMVKRGVVDLAATADWTPATGDTKVSKDGGNFANTTNNPAAVGGTGSIGWTITLTATELTAAVVDVQIVDSATKAVEDQYLKIYTYGNASAKIAADLSDAVRLGLTALPNANAGANGGLPLSVDTSGRVDVLKVNGTSQTARDLGASVLLSSGTGTGQLDFTSGVAKSNLTQINGASAGATNLDRSARAIVRGTVNTGASTTSIPTSSLDPAAAVADQFKSRVVIFDRDTTTANLRGQARDITASSSGGTLTVSALTDAPASGDTFVIL